MSALPPPEGDPVSMDAPAPEPVLSAPAESAATAPPRRRRVGLILGVTLGALGVLLIATGVTAYLVIASTHSPGASASRFLDLVVKGESREAVRQLSPAPDGSLDLVDDDVYDAAKHRITHYKIESTRTNGSSAEVVVLLTTDSGSTTARFDLVSAHRFLVFDNWTIDGTALPVIQVTSDRPAGVDVTANGIAIHGGKERSSYVALPGTYRFGIQSDDDTFVAADAHDVAITSLAAGTKSSELDVRLTSDGVAKARAAVDAYLDACTSQAVLSPSGDCGFEVTPPTDGSVLSNIRWSIRQRPVVSFDAWQDGGWTVKTDTSGSIEMDADFTKGREYGDGAALFDSYDVRGYIDIDDDGDLEFTSDYKGDKGNEPDTGAA